MGRQAGGITFYTSLLQRVDHRSTRLAALDLHSSRSADLRAAEREQHGFYLRP